jgi:hypothetical protein
VEKVGVVREREIAKIGGGGALEREKGCRIDRRGEGLGAAGAGAQCRHPHYGREPPAIE